MLSTDTRTNVTTIETPEPLLQPCRVSLDAAYDRLRHGFVAEGLAELFEDLSVQREEEPATWPAYARACLNHPVCQLLHQDPFTRRAFSKPRGYAGDAVMMDYIYGIGEARQAWDDATPIGRSILEYMSTRPSARAVRYRRKLLAELIDRAASRGGDRVFALAAGHLREVELSNAVQAGRLKEFVAVDQDEASLAVVDQDYSSLGIRAINGSVRQILNGTLNPGRFDLVYAAGLFDYLNAPVAAALTTKLFEMTRPGGTLLIPNFLEGAADTGYMESFMDWHLIYRNHSDMRSLAANLPRGEVATCEVFDDDDDTITFLAVNRTR